MDLQNMKTYSDSFQRRGLGTLQRGFSKDAPNSTGKEKLKKLKLK